MQFTCRSAFEAYFAHKVNELDDLILLKNEEIAKLKATIRTQEINEMFLESTCDFYYNMTKNFIEARSNSV